MIYKNVELYNVQEVLDEPDGIGFSRIPRALRATLPEFTQRVATTPAGCEIRFNQLSDEAKFTFNIVPAPLLAVYQGCFCDQIHVVSTNPTEVVIRRPANLDLFRRMTRQRRLPFDAGLTRLLFAHTSTTTMAAMTGDFAPLRAEQTPAGKLLMYGSSITQGSGVMSPTQTYAMTTARLLGMDLINLGLGGSALCEPQMAEYIAHRDDWDIAVLELGINLTVEPREFERLVNYFVETVAGENREKWVFCIDMFTYFGDFDRKERKHVEYRRVVRQAVARLKSLPRLVYLDGRRLLRTPAGLSTDTVHPSAEGMQEIAENLCRALRRRT